MMIEKIHALGHRNVRATHGTTVEFTKEKHLSLRGDCVVAVSAERGPQELPSPLVKAIARDESMMEVTIESGCCSATINGRGSSDLTLDHPTDFVIRKSTFTCPRTLMVGADMAAVDLPRELVETLRIDGSPVTITIRVVNTQPVDQGLTAGFGDR